MEFLVMSARRTDNFIPDQFAAATPAEGAKVRELYGQGLIRQIWHRADGTGACFLVEAHNADAATDAVSTLPMARDGLSDFTIIPLTPYRGFIS